MPGYHAVGETASGEWQGCKRSPGPGDSRLQQEKRRQAGASLACGV